VAFKLKYDNVEKYLRSYGKYIVRQAKNILSNRQASGKLANSLKYKLIKDKDGYDLKFLASKYGKFIEKGVSGTEVTRTYITMDGKRKSSPFRYKRGVGNAPNIGAIRKWISLKGIQGRNELGQYISNKSLAYLFSKSIQRKGIKAASYYAKPLSWSYKKFSEDLEKHFKDDVLKEIKAFKKTLK
jgi:hypothetical protein